MSIIGNETFHGRILVSNTMKINSSIQKNHYLSEVKALFKDLQGIIYFLSVHGSDFHKI